MQQNILKTSEISKIYFNFVDGKGIKRKELVTVRYMDKNSCYFKGQLIANFNKPRWRAKADVIVYTSEGIYYTQQIIRDVTFSLNEILYKIDLPKTWNFKQLRAGSRKKVSLPVRVVFADEVCIDSETLDLSVGGFAFESGKNLTTVQKNFPAKCTIEFPNDAIINFPDSKLETEIKYVRQKEITDEYDKEGWHIYSFKFTKLSPDENMILKNFLLKID